MKPFISHFKSAAIFCAVIMAIVFAAAHVLPAADHARPEQVRPHFVKGVVVYVHDGDTITVKKGRGKRIKIRFYGIDCPETEKKDAWKAQPYSEAAKAFVRKMILNKIVVVRLKGDKTYDRIVGEVFYDGRSVSRELVRNGLAWWNKKFEPFDSDLEKLQHQARQKRIGLWSDERPLPPWVHRYRAQKNAGRRKN